MGVEREHIEVVKILLSRGASDDILKRNVQTYLLIGARKGQNRQN